MFGLPVRTETNFPLPKERFYENMNIDSKLKKLFVDDVEKIVIVNNLCEATTNIHEGENVKQIMLLALHPKQRDINDKILIQIAKTNPHKLLFVNPENNTLSVYYNRQLYKNSTLSGLDIAGLNLDEVWYSLVTQIIFEDSNFQNLNERIELQVKVLKLEKEIVRLNKLYRKERQTVKHNYYYCQMQEAKRELKELLGE